MRSIRQSRRASKVAPWPTKLDVEYVFKAIGPPATEQVVERILEMIGPTERRFTGADAAVNLEYPDVVANLVRWIRAISPSKPPGELKSRLEADKKALERARAALVHLSDWLNYLPDNERSRLRVVKRFNANLDRLIERCRGDLDQLIERCRHRTTELKIERGGGPAAARHRAREKEAAALGASELWFRYCDGFPEGDRFYTIANWLFQAATGKPGDCKPACAAFLQALHQEVSIDKRAWRRSKKRVQPDSE
jgi:hypothetical protein